MSRKLVWCLVILVFFFLAADSQAKLFPRLFGRDKGDETSLPSSPIAKAAVQGVYDAYRESLLYEAKNISVIRSVPMVPSDAFVQQHDPSELYCVCTEFQSRYKVPWTRDSSDWQRTVRNVLVMQTQGGHYVAMQPFGICPEHCE